MPVINNSDSQKKLAFKYIDNVYRLLIQIIVKAHSCKPVRTVEITSLELELILKVLSKQLRIQGDGAIVLNS